MGPKFAVLGLTWWRRRGWCWRCRRWDRRRLHECRGQSTGCPWGTGSLHSPV